ncbi:MAG TPA: hypothetical protein VH081_07705 [Solirubrobacteraceae bacterium]|jgi:hypothetical protein|nr:hypothetical protein [Solirubrobacteraceae bacterium]
MSTNDPNAMPPSGPGAAGAPGQPSEEELRAAYEAELSRITSAELMLQAAVSLLNVGSFRLAPRTPAPGAGDPASASSAPSAADLEQARDAIDAVRALLEIIERQMPNETAPLRNALSQLQMIYAREAQAAGAPASGAGDPAQGATAPLSGGAAGGAPGEAKEPGDAPGEQPGGPGPAESSGRLWVPGR